MQFIYNIFVLQVDLKWIRRTRVRTHQHKAQARNQLKAQVIRKQKAMSKKTFYFIPKLCSTLHRSFILKLFSILLRRLKHSKIHIRSPSHRPEKLRVLKWAHCECVSGVSLLTQPYRLTSDFAPLGDLAGLMDLLDFTRWFSSCGCWDLSLLTPSLVVEANDPEVHMYSNSIIHGLDPAYKSFLDFIWFYISWQMYSPGQIASLSSTRMNLRTMSPKITNITIAVISAVDIFSMTPSEPSDFQGLSEYLFLPFVMLYFANFPNVPSRYFLSLCLCLNALYNISWRATPTKMLLTLKCFKAVCLLLGPS